MGANQSPLPSDHWWQSIAQKANDIPQVITGDDPDPNTFIEKNKTDFWGKTWKLNLCLK